MFICELEDFLWLSVLEKSSEWQIFF